MLCKVEKNFVCLPSYNKLHHFLHLNYSWFGSPDKMVGPSDKITHLTQGPNVEISKMGGGVQMPPSLHNLGIKGLYSFRCGAGLFSISSLTPSCTHSKIHLLAFFDLNLCLHYSFCYFHFIFISNISITIIDGALFFLKGEFTFFYSRIGCPPIWGVKLDWS